MSGRRLRSAKMVNYRDEPDKDLVDPCTVCGRTAQEDSNRCLKCGEWVHDQCSRYRKGDSLEDFTCPICMVAGDAPSVEQANSSGQSSGLTQAVNDIRLSDTTLAKALDENHCGLTQAVAELSLSNEGHEEDNVTVQPVDVISTSVGRLETYTDLETKEFFNVLRSLRSL